MYHENLTAYVPDLDTATETGRGGFRYLISIFIEKIHSYFYVKI